MPTISLGKVALTWRGAYDAATAYSVQDVVSYNGSSYICKVATTGNLPTDATKWDLLAQGVNGIAADPGDLLYFDGSDLVALPAGTSGSLLRIDNSGFPAWEANQARSGMRASGLISADGVYRRGAAVMSDGTVRWWGRGASNVLGTGATVVARTYPVRVAFPASAAPIVKIWATYDASAYALDADGKFWGWGANSYGQLGTGNTTAQFVPFCISEQSGNTIVGKTVIDYAPMVSPEGYESALVLCSDGTVHSCGYGAHGQLGMGDTTSRSYFNQVPLLSNIVQIARGRERYTSCYAINASGELYSWGYNATGELGHGDAIQRNIPTLVTYFQTNNIVVDKVRAGGGFVFAISDTGTLYGWGYNGYGNLGNGNVTNQSTPVQVTTGIQDVFPSGGANDYSRSYAIVSGNKSVIATGDNSYGCLGVDGTTTDRNTWEYCRLETPTSFGPQVLTGAAKVSVGGTGSYNHATILFEDGTCAAVGYSASGNIGTGNYNSTNYHFRPVPIHRRRVVDIAGVGSTSEAAYMYLMDDGQVYQTGSATEAQFPDDDAESVPVPSPVLF